MLQDRHYREMSEIEIEFQSNIKDHTKLYDFIL